MVQLKCSKSSNSVLRVDRMFYGKWWPSRMATIETAFPNNVHSMLPSAILGIRLDSDDLTRINMEWLSKGPLVWDTRGSHIESHWMLLTLHSHVHNKLTSVITFLIAHKKLKIGKMNIFHNDITICFTRPDGEIIRDRKGLCISHN